MIFKKGQQEFGMQVMEIIAYEPDLIENAVTRREDRQGTAAAGKFMESQLWAAAELKDS